MHLNFITVPKDTNNMTSQWGEVLLKCTEAQLSPLVLFLHQTLISYRLLMNLRNITAMTWDQNPEPMGPSCSVREEQTFCSKSHLVLHSSTLRLTASIPSYQHHRAPQHLACVPGVLCAWMHIQQPLKLQILRRLHKKYIYLSGHFGHPVGALIWMMSYSILACSCQFSDSSDFSDRKPWCKKVVNVTQLMSLKKWI